MKKYRIISALLIAFMLMGSMPVFAETSIQGNEVSNAYVKVKALFPNADILEDMGNPTEILTIHQGQPVFRYDVMRGDSEPVQEIDRFTKNSHHKLLVYEDGSYMMTALEAPAFSIDDPVINASILGEEVINWDDPRIDPTNNLYVYEDVRVYAMSGVFTFGFYFDAQRGMFSPYTTTITRAYGQYSGGNYVYSGSPGIRNSGKQTYQRFLKTELIDGIPMTYAYELRATVYNGPAALPTASIVAQGLYQ